MEKLDFVPNNALLSKIIQLCSEWYYSKKIDVCGKRLMDKEEFCVYLKKGGRSPGDVNLCKIYFGIWSFLTEKRNRKQLAEVTDQDLVNYVSVLNKDSITNAKGYL